MQYRDRQTGHTDTLEFWHEFYTVADDHYSPQARVSILIRTGKLVAVGDGVVHKHYSRTSTPEETAALKASLALSQLKPWQWIKRLQIKRGMK